MEHLFEKIALGEVPSFKVYETELVYAFLDINPLAPGHTLIIPKKKYETLDQIPDETAAALGLALPKVARAVMKATECTDYNVLQNNGVVAHQAVPHVHFHIIPKPGPGQGLGVTWPVGKLQDGEAMQKKIVDMM